MSNKWPREMPTLEPRDFVVGEWEVVIDAGDLGEYDYTEHLTPKELESHHCKTACCLIGHVRHCFGEPSNPAHGNPTPPAGIRFARKFIELWKGKEFAKYVRDQNDCVAAFDGDLVVSSPNFQEEHDLRLSELRRLEELDEAIDPDTAAAVWAQTLKAFGYTEDVYE